MVSLRLTLRAAMKIFMLRAEHIYMYVVAKDVSLNHPKPTGDKTSAEKGAP